MADGEVLGATFRVQYGEIAERYQFRIGRVGSEVFDAYFPIESLADVTAVLTAAPALSVKAFSRGTNYQTQKREDWQNTIALSPLSYSPTPALFELYTAEVPELVSLLGQLSSALSVLDPGDWDETELEPLPEAQLPVRLSEASLDEVYETSMSASPYLVADGTTDNAAGFAAAVSAAAAAGRELVLPPGTIVMGPVSITPTNHLKIRGSGLGRTILKMLPTAVTPAYLLRFSGGSFRVELSDLTLDGNNVVMDPDVLSSVLRFDSRNANQSVVHHAEVRNSNKTGVIAYNSALDIQSCWVHDVVLEGITPHATHRTVVANNLVENCTRNGIRIGSSASTTKYDGVLTVVEGNTIRNITDAFAGTGQYGNGILVYRVANVIVRGNTISNVDWAFIRANRADNIVIANNSGMTNVNQQGIFVEFNSCYATITGNKITSVDGISVANVDQGTFESTVTGNIVKTSGATARGIWCESGVVANNVIDGGGTGRYGVSQIGGNTSSLSQLTVVGNRISGVKYAVGLPATNTHVDSFTEVSGNRVTRKDANWSSFFGALGGSSSDAGAGNAITTYAAKVFVDQPTENIASGSEPPAMKAGSRLLINNVVKTSSGSAWV